nr:MAG TPA_asm: hypothetical protein [Caudoviricetes sp.]
MGHPEDSRAHSFLRRKLPTEAQRLTDLTDRLFLKYYGKE